jgi:hypothetical protein
MVRHTGESTTEDEKLWTLCTLLVTLIHGDAGSKVSTTVGDSCGSPTAGCVNWMPSIVGGLLVVAGPWKLQNLLVVLAKTAEKRE